MGNLGPEHEMAKTAVSFPTVMVRKAKPEEGLEEDCIAIQWYGESESPHMPEGAQFFFDILCPLDNPHWIGDPNSFRVVFLGQVENWHNPGELDSWLEESGNTPNTTIAWFMSPISRVQFEPSSFIANVVLLGDPVCGIIRPRLYRDLTVISAVKQEAEAGMSLADKLVRNPRIDLPPEEIPWTDQWPDCSCLESLGKSHDRKPGIPEGGSCHDLSYVCLTCRRRWWQYNSYYHLWKHVTDPGEWNCIRRQQILHDGGYEDLDEQ